MVLVGSLGMLFYPWLADVLLRGEVLPAGVFLGSTIHDTSQVIGASLIYAQQFGAPDVVGFASATKLFRNLSMLILVPLIAWFARGPSASEPHAAHRRGPAVPPFVIWFAVLVMVRALGDHLVATGMPSQHLWETLIGGAEVLSNLCMTCGMTAVGLNISLAQVHQVGFRPLCAALIIAAATAACSIGMVKALLL